MMHKFNPAQLAITGLLMTVVGLIGVVPMVFSGDDMALAAPVVPPPAAVVQQAPAAPQIMSGHPVRIEAPRVSVNMSVVDGFYDTHTGNWTLYDNKAQFAAMTAEPNDKTGQTFIYGHATQAVFGKLLNMKLGDEVFVDTANSYRFIYTLKDMQVVSPSNTGILSYQGAPRLLLQTCVGTFSENRKFFILEFTRVEKL